MYIIFRSIIYWSERDLLFLYRFLRLNKDRFHYLNKGTVSSFVKSTKNISRAGGFGRSGWLSGIGGSLNWGCTRTICWFRQRGQLGRLMLLSA